MKIKERFTVYKHIDGSTRELVSDNKNNSIISIIEAERICTEEYGEHFSFKAEYISKSIDIILASVDFYNSNCEEGFEITAEDLINKITTKELCSEKKIGI